VLGSQVDGLLSHWQPAVFANILNDWLRCYSDLVYACFLADARLTCPYTDQVLFFGGTMNTFSPVLSVLHQSSSFINCLVSIFMVCVFLTYILLWCLFDIVSIIFEHVTMHVPYISRCELMHGWYRMCDFVQLWCFVQLIECLMSLRADMMHRVGLVDSNRDTHYSSFIVCQPR